MPVVCTGMDLLPDAQGYVLATVCIEVDSLDFFLMEKLQAEIHQALMNAIKTLYERGFYDALKSWYLRFTEMLRDSKAVSELIQNIIRCALMSEETRRHHVVCEDFVKEQPLNAAVLDIVRGELEKKFSSYNWATAVVIGRQIYVFGTSRELEKTALTTLMADYVLSYWANLLSPLPKSASSR